jgi:hypothetical protein
MGAVEHLKTLCCLGLPPESAMVSVTPLLHEIIPHGWARWALLEPDGTIGRGYSENPATSTIFRDRMWKFVDDLSSPMSLWMSCFRSVGIGWTLHMQGRGWLDRAWYREIEAPLDSCWILDAMIGDAGKTCAIVSLTRPRSARPFTVEDVQRLDRLRPWLAHAFRPAPLGSAGAENEDPFATAGAPVASGEMILGSDGEIVFQTNSVEFLLNRVLTGERGNYTHHTPVDDRLPSQVQMLIRRIVGAANGISGDPPRMQVSNGYGVITLEAKWLVPKGAAPEDVSKDPNCCLISVVLELREHRVAHAARILRERGATPSQVKLGIQLALGKRKPIIADELGIKLSSVADQTKRLYQTLDIHSSTELGTKIWLGELQTNRANVSGLTG